VIIELCGKQKMPAVLYRLCSYNISLFAAAAENNLRRYTIFQLVHPFTWRLYPCINNVYINIKVAVLYSATGSPFYKDKENAIYYYIYYYRPREMYSCMNLFTEHSSSSRTSRERENFSSSRSYRSETVASRPYILPACL
jgi:hypothetical protein